MNVEPLVYWFPIIIAAAACGRVVPRRHGLGLGLCCAGFWIFLVLSSTDSESFTHSHRALLLFVGALPITLLPLWVADWSRDASASRSIPAVRSAAPGVGRLLMGPDEAIARLGDSLDQFRDWLDRRALEKDPWLDFGEWLRMVLHRLTGATHVRLYRLVGADGRLVPIRDIAADSGVEWPEAREGLLGHVATTGRSYFQGDLGQGELIENLAAEAKPCPQWCFSVRSGARRIGLVAVGGFEGDVAADPTLRRAVELVVEQFWTRLSEVSALREAAGRDPISGLLSRQSFVSMGEVVARECAEEGRPVAVAIIAIEGLRQLNDVGQWEMADELVQEGGAALLNRLRSCDLIGRFDGSRFVVLLHGVDSHLASLILRKALDQLESTCGDQARWRTILKLRCGLAGSGHQKPTLHFLISRALRLCHKARGDQRIIASDLEATPSNEAVNA